ncbi:MAG: NADH:flavin oxidoreductase [Myxococcota bacterium]|nr:NADH:flavin oxidoreductase [Myxococcota bacterium]
MSLSPAAQPLTFSCGLSMKNRFMLAPMTNHQSHADGRLSDDEFRWLTMRARGGFGLTMTCASHVQPVGQGFPGQLGIFSDDLLDGHKRLSAGIRREESLAVIQLHHAGTRSPETLIGQTPICPSADPQTGARAMTHDEVLQLRDDFIAAGIRAKEAGYHGVELHGAHGYIICQFLSPRYNRREDEYGGSPENRARLSFEILRAIRRECGPNFLLGMRISPERYGLQLNETLAFSQKILDAHVIDFLDVSLWDSFKYPEEENHQQQTLLAYITQLQKNDVKLTVAGKISTAKHVRQILDSGIDFVTIGRAGIIHHDYPKKVLSNPNFEPMSTPVTREHLAKEGLGEKFIDYMTRWKGFVSSE